MYPKRFKVNNIKIRIMQKYLKKLTQDSINNLINRIGKQFATLMTDIYGNYFCQKFIQCCSSRQRIMILNNVYNI